MLKLVGAALIMFAGTAYGFYRASRYARRPRELRYLTHALTTLESEIVFGVTPLPAALNRVASAVPSPLSHLFGSAARKLRASQGERTADECWKEAVSEAWPSTAMQEAERETMLSLGATLGVTDRADQSKHIKLCIAQLQAEEITARDEQARYEKMWRSLGALGAAVVVILMY
ncbi:stage III sporulation protein SpoIIIAB [Paenibacillus thermotolerans]|uniref:stage III sporulation protein SpoIIIAB n=1 Tax=Paenibacillus thermotolerans TaxID=3027807 RepID=UPI0023688544|nr:MULTISPECIES: stage III sporulation protein SpoIIIAB [unclassified Paenibacillus]